MTIPKVQVVCITYNHEKYIAEALNSFVRQNTNFPYEVLVGDDCSTDNTGKIVAEYAERYPDIIKVIPRESNMGPTRNLMDLISHCTAPYIAFCEGDDYWIDDYKLQKQFDFMENNPNIRICYTKTKVVYPENWGTLDWYKPINGEIIIPDSIPGCAAKRYISAHGFITNFCAHTSSHFYRWNYEMEVPEWFHGGYSCDISIFMMQLGDGVAAMLDDVTSVYRRSEVGVAMAYDPTENFLKTRKEYIRFLYGLILHFKEKYSSFACLTMEKRLKNEIVNLIRACNKKGDYSALTEVLTLYPDAMAVGMKSMLNIWGDHLNMINRYTWNGYLALSREKNMMRRFAPIVKSELEHEKKRLLAKKRRSWFKKNFIDRFRFDANFYLRIYPDVRKAGVDARKHYFKYGWKEGRLPYPPSKKYFNKIKSWLWYWCGALVPKRRESWVFSSFMKRGYEDNVKYMYEYVVRNHPEIDALWLTSDTIVFNKLKARGMPVKMMRKAKWAMLRAQVAFTDHFRCSDYLNKWGFNAGTKVVQLWHGVGLKSIGDLKNTDVPGVQFSSDILSQPGDSLWTRIEKKISYISKAPFRELFEEYFLLVCPGVERVKQIAEPWGIPEKSIMYSGHPRNIHLHSSAINTETPMVLYAPTYRWDSNVEKGMVDNMVQHAGEIQQLMEKWNAYFTIRLHPHTWRNYKSVILSGIKDYDRIKLDEEKDIYTRLGDYSVVITDYSSIAYDFILLNRPVVFYAFDIDDFLTSEVKLNYPFETHSPGAQTRDWESTIAAIDEYLDNPEKDNDWRCRIRDEFYDMSVNDAENSGRIVREIKKRLNIK